MIQGQTLSPVELADLTHIATLQRKAERHKAALAKLEQILAKTRGHLREKSEDAAFARDGVTLVLALLSQERVTEATLILQELDHGLRGELEARLRALARARTRDHTLLTLRAKVSALHRALAKAKETIGIWHGDFAASLLTEPETACDRLASTWALYQSSPEMQEINRALGE